MQTNKKRYAKSLVYELEKDLRIAAEGIVPWFLANFHEDYFAQVYVYALCMQIILFKVEANGAQQKIFCLCFAHANV